MFYQSSVASSIFHFCGVLGQMHQCKINKLIRKADSVVGCQLDSLEEEAEDADQTAGRHRQHFPPPP